jgi:hypothetical protein
MKLREYQIEISEQAAEKLKRLGCIYLSMSVRTGKTLTALNIAKLINAKSVLFLTKLRAIDSIKSDYEMMKPDFKITIINNESMHKVEGTFDLIISDENHRNSAFPKPNKSAKYIRERWGHLPFIFLSGTPAAESGSQWFHSFWICKNNPFNKYKNFYEWSKIFTNDKVKYLGQLKVKDYSDSKDDLIKPIINPYIFTYTQEEAGFETKINERVIYCEMSEITNKLINILLKDYIIRGNNETILADTPVKLMSKTHQLSNGSVIFESGNSKILDKTKAKFIKEYFKNNKIAIFYFFKQEYELLKDVFGESLTNDLNEFNTTDKNIALQQIAGSEGISLKKADKLVYYSFGYSGKNYIQGRDRLTTIDRNRNEVYFVFQKGDINEKIYNVIKNKKKYNEKIFIKDVRKQVRTKMVQKSNQTRLAMY